MVLLLFFLSVIPLFTHATQQEIELYLTAKQYGKAVAACQAILVREPYNLNVRTLLGDAYIKSGNYLQGCNEWERVITKQQDNWALKLKLADAYTEQEQFERACTLYTEKMTLDHRDTLTRFKYGTTCLKMGHITTALETFETILRLIKNPVSVLYNIGYTLKTAGRIDEALQYYDKIIELDPTYESVYLARGFALLNKGDFKNGWIQHEHYLKSSHKNADMLRELLARNNINAKHIVLSYEGGLGDTLMFIRYAHRLKQMGAYITCIVQNPLMKLLENHPDIDELRTLEMGYVLPHDARATLMSLPAVFHDTEETMPRDVPYLYPQQDLVEEWNTKLIPNKKLHIGLCWQTDAHNDVSRLPIARRGMPLALWHSLCSIPDVAVYSLQRFDGVEQIKDVPENATLHVFDNLDTDHGSFVDSAALIQNLDIVISVDTAVAHLAGALGKPVLLLLPYSVDWRWIWGRTDSPWYPTMRIFKQPEPFDWNTVVDTVHTYIYKTYTLKVTPLH